jgi:hypothetical protein
MNKKFSLKMKICIKNMVAHLSASQMPKIINIILDSCEVIGMYQLVCQHIVHTGLRIDNVLT